MNDAFSGSKCISEAIYSRNEVLKCTHWVMEGRKETRPFYRIIVFKSFQNCQCPPSITKKSFSGSPFAFSSMHLLEAQLTSGMCCSLWHSRPHSWALRFFFSAWSLSRDTLYPMSLTQAVLWGFFVVSINDTNSFANVIAWLRVSSRILCLPTFLFIFFFFGR